MQTSGHVDDDEQISALDTFYEMDGRKGRYIGEVLEWYRREDAGDRKRIELVEKWTCLEKKICQRSPKTLTEEKSWRTWRSKKNIVMDAKFVKNFVMGAKIDPKVEMDLSLFKVGGWKILQLSIRKLLEESIEEDELQLLFLGTLSRDSFLVMHHVKELTLLREGLHEMVQRYKRQHFVASNNLHEHSRGHSSWRESTRMKFMNIQMEYPKMRSESSEYMWKTRVILILIHLVGRHAQKVWERNWMRRKTGDGRQSLSLNEINATRCEFVGSREAGFC